MRNIKGIFKSIISALVVLGISYFIVMGFKQTMPGAKSKENNIAIGIISSRADEEDAEENTENINVVNINLTPNPEGTKKKLDCAYVAFTFDDGYVSDYELAYKILKKYGIRGTSYIIPEFQDEKRPYTLTWAQIKEMYRYGWVFGCHTYAHSNLTKLTAEDIKESMEEVNKSLMRQGLPKPVVGAYPYGKYNQQVIEAIKSYRAQMRKALYETKLVDINSVNPYEIDSVSADMRSEKRLKEHEAAVDKACRENKVIVFRCHCLYRTQVNDMGEWPVQTDSRLFEQLVMYCADKGCRFITMKDLIELYS
jgi:peptidoglycan/xylan/chitin deacetylase (PgdA/CDA1 family)